MPHQHFFILLCLRSQGGPTRAGAFFFSESPHQLVEKWLSPRRLSRLTLRSLREGEAVRAALKVEASAAVWSREMQALPALPAACMSADSRPSLPAESIGLRAWSGHGQCIHGGGGAGLVQSVVLQLPYWACKAAAGRVQCQIEVRHALITPAHNIQIKWTATACKIPFSGFARQGLLRIGTLLSYPEAGQTRCC